MTDETTHDLRIRSATAMDAERIARIYVDSWRETYAGILPKDFLVSLSVERHTAFWRSSIMRRGPRDAVLVAEDRDYGVVGFSSLGRARDHAMAYAGEVYTLYVDPNHVGRGVGGELLTASFAKLADYGYASAVIWALAGNPARYFYERRGGRLVAERDGSMGGAATRELGFGWADTAAAAGGALGARPGEV